MELKNKLRSLGAIFGILSLIFTNSSLGFAHDEGDFEAVHEDGTDEAKILDLGAEQEQFLNRLKQELNLSKTDYKQLLKRISETKLRLDTVTEENLSLKEQLENLEKQITYSNERLISVLQLLVHSENEVALLDEQLEITEIALAEQKEMFEDYLRIMYQEEKLYLTREEDGTIDAVKMLLSDRDVTENLRNMEYLNLLREAGQQMMERLNLLEIELAGQQRALTLQREKLDGLRERFAKEKEQLQLQKESKERLVKVTAGQEEVYAELLQQTIYEQEELIGDIKSLSDTLNFIEQKIAEEGADFDPSEYEHLLEEKDRELYDFHLQSLEYSACELSWPVKPKRGISAYFREAAYNATFGMQHNAVDIPEYQGSPIRAAGDAIVYKTKDNGYGYSYVILAHPCGYMTIYGHVSKILVHEGDMIPRGTIVALSGGMPGTLGAGYMTTGPHLHLELLLNGNHVDPLKYLDLSELSEDQISALPDKYRPKWEQDLLDKRGRVVRDDEVKVE